MRLGILGGTFDPIHYGHLLLAECCREQLRLDQVWFLPNAVSPHKQGRPAAPGELRVEMIELAISGHEPFAVCRYEVDRGGVNFSVDTLAHMREQDPRRELFFLLGADSLAELPTWREPERICQLARLVAVRRGCPEPDFSVVAGLMSPEALAEIRGLQVEMPQIGISASDIRRRVSQGLSIRYRTPRAVQVYIETHGLYAAS